MLNGISNNNNKGLVCTRKVGGRGRSFMGKLLRAKPRIINKMTRINGGRLYENILNI